MAGIVLGLGVKFRSEGMVPEMVMIVWKPSMGRIPGLAKTLMDWEELGVMVVESGWR